MRQKTYAVAHSKAPQSFNAVISVLARNVQSAHIIVIDAFAVFRAKELTSVLVYSVIESTLSLQEKLEAILQSLKPYMINSLNLWGNSGSIRVPQSLDAIRNGLLLSRLGNTPSIIAIACWLGTSYMQPLMHLDGVDTYDLASSRAVRELTARCVQMGNPRWRMTAYEGRAETQRRSSYSKFKIIVIAAILRLGLSIRALCFIRKRLFLSSGVTLPFLLPPGKGPASWYCSV